MNSTTTENDLQNASFDQTILKYAPYGIVACNLSGKIIFANQLADFMLHEKNLQGKNLLHIMAGVPDFQKGWGNLRNEYHNQFAMPFSIIQDRPNTVAGNTGTDANLSVRVTRFETSSELKCNTLVFIEDLSSNETLDVADQLYTDSLEILMQEKSQELELIQEQLILSEKKAAMIETAGAVAHELRQPMTTIIGTIDLLSTKHTIRENPDIEKRFKIIQKQCLRMAETIKQMEKLVEYKTRQYVKDSLIIDLEESSLKK